MACMRCRCDAACAAHDHRICGLTRPTPPEGHVRSLLTHTCLHGQSWSMQAASCPSPPPRALAPVVAPLLLCVAPRHREARMGREGGSGSSSDASACMRRRRRARTARGRPGATASSARSDEQAPMRRMHQAGRQALRGRHNADAAAADMQATGGTCTDAVCTHARDDGVDVFFESESAGGPCLTRLRGGPALAHRGVTATHHI
jgi:hypothetical protein